MERTKKDIAEFSRKMRTHSKATLDEELRQQMIMIADNLDVNNTDVFEAPSLLKMFESWILEDDSGLYKPAKKKNKKKKKNPQETVQEEKQSEVEE